MVNKISFAGQREDRNNVDKLTAQKGALNFNNQRNIKQSIENLSNNPSTKNAVFLMNVAEQIKYGLNANIEGVKPNNDWMAQLREAAEKNIEGSKTKQEALRLKFQQVFENHKDLTPEEKEVLSLRESLLKTTGLQNEIKTSDNDNVRNIEKNLNYFVVSSEVTIDEKKQVLEKLNTFMSSDFKVEKQLENKKPQLLGEMLNDLVVKTAEQDMPTIKQVDQRHHGMCADISFARKNMAYEYKPQYVDIVMQEVSANPEMEVYDISKLGTGAKLKISKTPIDYAYAEEKGYRLIDASTLQWMNAANKTGDGTVETGHFSAFDREYFDTFHDGHYNRTFSDKKLASQHEYLRALEKADDKAKEVVKKFNNVKMSALEQKMNEKQNAQHLAIVNRTLGKELSELMPKADAGEIHKTVNELIRLNQDKKNEFYIVDAEEEYTKKLKIGKFITSKNPDVDKDLMNKKMDDIYNLYADATETLDYMNKEIEPKTEKSRMMKYYKPLYEVATTYRTSIDKSLDIPEMLQDTAKGLGLSEKATKAEVMKAMEKDGTIVSEDILRSLQDKYNKIAKHAAVVEKAEVKGDVVNIKNLYSIDKKEADALEVINKNLKSIAKEVNVQTETMEEIMFEPLNALAKQIGLEKGQFYTHKEGSSGLSAPLEIRIYEQMTGKRYYKEDSLENVVNVIKDSDHSGISTSSVYHNDHGWHAMYIADVAGIPVKNPKTGKIEYKDAIMHDNSWGLAEKKNNWVDSEGVERTDYACGRGGATGYITNSLWQNGLFVDDIINKPMVVRDAAGNVNYTGRMLTGALLTTQDSLAAEPAAELVNDILSGSAKLNNSLKLIEKEIESGKVSVQDLNNIKLRRDTASQINDLKKNYNKGVYAKVHSQADWDKIDANDSAKMLMERVAVAMSADSQTVYDYAMKLKNPEDIKKAEKAVHNFAVKDLAKTIRNTNIKDYNLNEYQVDPRAEYGKTQKQLAKQFIDRVYDPVDNKEFAKKLDELQHMSNTDLVKFIQKNATNEDLGIHTMTGYDALDAMKKQNPRVEEIAKHFVWVDTLNDTVGLTKEGRSLGEQYHILKNKLGSLGNAEYARRNAKAVFKQYGARMSFPDNTLYDRQQVLANGKYLLEIAAQNVMAIKTIEDPEQRRESAKALREDLNANISANIDRVHRNRVMNTLNNFMNEVEKSPNSAEMKNLAKEFMKDFDRYSIAKDVDGIVDEYLTLLATKENDQQAQILKSYITAAIDKANANEIQGKVMDAISKGTAHEFGQEISNMTLYGKDKKGNDVSFKVSDDPAMMYELSDKTIALSGALAAATMFNSLALGEKTMESISKVFSFKNLANAVQKQPKLKGAMFRTILDKVKFVEALNVKASPAATKLKETFLKEALETVKTLKAAK